MALGPAHAAWVSKWYSQFILNNDGERTEGGIRAEWGALAKEHFLGYEMPEDDALIIEQDAVVRVLGVEVTGAISLEARAALAAFDPVTAASLTDAAAVAIGGEDGSAPGNATSMVVDGAALGAAGDSGGEHADAPSAAAAAGPAAASSVAAASPCADVAAGPSERKVEPKLHAYLNRLWQLRRKYMAFYILDRFTDGLRTTGRNESQHSVIKDVLPNAAHMSLTDVVLKLSELVKQKAEQRVRQAMAANGRTALQARCPGSLLVSDAYRKLTPFAATLIDEAMFAYGLSYNVGELVPIGDRQKRVVVTRNHGVDRLARVLGHESDMVINAEFECDKRVVVITFADEGRSIVAGMSCSCRRHIWQRLPCVHVLKVLTIGLQADTSLPDYLYDARWRREQMSNDAVMSDMVMRPALSSLVPRPVLGGARISEDDRRRAYADVKALFQPSFDKIGQQGMAIMPWVAERCRRLAAELEEEIGRLARLALVTPAASVDQGASGAAGPSGSAAAPSGLAAVVEAGPLATHVADPPLRAQAGSHTRRILSAGERGGRGGHGRGGRGKPPVVAGGASPGGTADGPAAAVGCGVKRARDLTCTSCKQPGHMRNNHLCPNYSSHAVKGPEQEGPG